MAERPQRAREPVGPADDALDRMVGRTLADRYRIERPIGSGGMGTVFLAEHVLIHKPVAIKVLSPVHSRKRAEVERFLREAQTASRIRHEHIVDITDFGNTREGLAFLVMEYLEGEDLATTSEREGPMPWRRAVKIILQIAAALEAAHAQGVIHRDMKPENCFRIRRGNDPDFIKVLDFGIAKIIDEVHDESEPSSSNSGLLGTPEYVAPELVRGLKADARVDIYAVGVIFYALLAGKLPFERDTFMATLTAHLMEEPPPPTQIAPKAQIPAAIEQIVLKALVKDRDQRYQTITEFITAVNEAAAAIEGPAVQPSGGGMQPRVVLGVVVALILIFAAVLWFVVERLRGADATTEPPAVARAEPSKPVEPEKRVEAKAEPTKVEPPPETKVEPTKVEPVAPASPPETQPPDDAGPSEPVKAAPSKKAVARDLLAALSPGEFAGKMLALSSSVRAECSKYALKKMAVTVQVVVAADGKVKSATPTGSQAGSTLGNCVAKVVKTAKFGKTRAKSTHTHTFTM